MSSINALPASILVRILSFLKKFELILIESVSPLWKSIIHEYFWKNLFSISEAMIGYPFEADFLYYFVEMSHRIERCREFENPFGLMERRHFIAKKRANKEVIDEQLRLAVLELINKRTPDAVLPLDCVRDMFRMALSQKPSKKSKSQSEETRAMIEQTMRECHGAEFSAIRLNNVLLHQKGSLGGHSLCIHQDAGGDTLFPLEMAKITRIVVGRLVIRVEGRANSPSLAMVVESWRNRFASFPNLDVIEIESIELVIPSECDESTVDRGRLPGEEPLLLVSVVFDASNRCRLSVQELNALLDLVATGEELSQNSGLHAMMKQWKREGRIAAKCKAEFHSSQFKRMQDVLVQESDDDKCPVDAMLAAVFPRLTDSLELVCAMQYEDDDHFYLLAAEGVIARLRHFSLAFVEPMKFHCKMKRKDLTAFLDKAYRTLDLLSDEFAQLESLRVDLMAAGNRWVRAEDEPTVTRPLPALRSMEFIGFPSFSFLVSVLQQAPHLQRLVVHTQPFTDERVGLQRVLQLLAAMQDSCQLSYFALKSCDAEGMIRSCHDYRRRTPRNEKKLADLQPLLTEIKVQLTHLVARLPQLVCVEVNIASCELAFDVDKRL